MYFVDPDSQELVRSPEPPLPGALIQEGDNFKISLDFGFLRYLQAVDPYVIVFSEAWMGPQPKPTDANLLHRQVVLSKEGVTPNANFPISFQPLLGPVTLGEGSHDVHVTLKVVVLSKYDNKQTIELLNGLTAVAAAAAPQYAPAAGALADVGAAVVAQNKDKIEFEHTFTLSPKTPEYSTDLNRKLTHGTLRTGKIVVVKGESEFRVVPYQHPGYYLWLFNWAGNAVDHNSRRYEAKQREVELNYVNALWFVVRIPFWIVGSLFVPSEWAFDEYKGLDPLELKVDGDSLVCKQTYFEEYRTIWQRILYGPPLKDMCAGWPIYPYSEKTFMVFKIEKSESTFGTFFELVTKFSEHGKTINTLTTSSSEARTFSDEQIKRAFASVEKTVIFERAKKKIRQGARKGYFNTKGDFKNLGFDEAEENLLVQRTVNARVRASVSEYTHFAELVRERIHKQKMEMALKEKMTSPSPTDTKRAEEIEATITGNLKSQGASKEEIEEAVKEEVAMAMKEEIEKRVEGSFLDQVVPSLFAYMKQTRWDNEDMKNSKYPNLWKEGWTRVLAGVRKWLFSLDPADASQAFAVNSNEWEDLQTLPISAAPPTPPTTETPPTAESGTVQPGASGNDPGDSRRSQ